MENMLSEVIRIENNNCTCCLSSVVPSSKSSSVSVYLRVTTETRKMKMYGGCTKEGDSRI